MCPLSVFSRRAMCIVAMQLLWVMLSSALSPYPLVNLSVIRLSLHADSVTSDTSSAQLYYLKAAQDCVYSINQWTLLASSPLNFTETLASSGSAFSTVSLPLMLTIIAVDATGQLHAYDGGNGAVISVDKDGNWLNYLRTNNTLRLWSMAVSPTGDRIAANSAAYRRINVLALPSGEVLHSIAVVTSSAVAFDRNNHLFISLPAQILEYDQYGQFFQRHNTTRGVANNIVIDNSSIIFSTRQTNLCWVPAASPTADNSTTGCTTVQFIEPSPSALTQGSNGTVVGIGVKGVVRPTRL